MSADLQARAKSPDAGKAVGMTVIYAGMDLEQAADELAGAGFEAAEVFVGHLGPRVVAAPVFEAHASAARKVLEARGLGVSTLNCIVGEFDPFSSDEALEATAGQLAYHIRLGAAIGSPRVLIWDGELSNTSLVPTAPRRLAQMISRARELAGGGAIPDIAVELHPNTFGLKFKVHEAVAEALLAIEAGICLDFCHASVALGPDFAAHLSPAFLRAVSHVHYADSDCTSEQLHFPLGEGRVDIRAAEERLAGRGIGVAWDLFGWPAPRAATKSGMDRYLSGVDRIGRSAAGAGTVR